DLDVVGVGGRSPLVDDDGGAPVRLHVDDQVAGSRGGRVDAGDADVGGTRGRRVLRDRDDRGLGDGGVRPGADPVGGQECTRRSQPGPFDTDVFLDLLHQELWRGL